MPDKNMTNILFMFIISFVIVLMFFSLSQLSGVLNVDPVQAFKDFIDALELSVQKRSIEKGYKTNQGYLLVQLLAVKDDCDTNSPLAWYNYYCTRECNNVPCLCLITSDTVENFKDSDDDISSMFSSFSISKDMRNKETMLVSSGSPETSLRQFTVELTPAFQAYFGNSPKVKSCSPLKLYNEEVFLIVDNTNTLLMMTQCVKISNILAGPLVGNELSITGSSSEKKC